MITETSNSVFKMSLWASVALMCAIGVLSFSAGWGALLAILEVGCVAGFLIEVFRLNGVDND